MQSAVLKMRRKSTEDFTFSAVIERTFSLGGGREKHGWSMASKQHLPKVD